MLFVGTSMARVLDLLVVCPLLWLVSLTGMLTCAHQVKDQRSPVVGLHQLLHVTVDFVIGYRSLLEGYFVWAWTNVCL